MIVPVEATYEDGVLKLAEPLPLAEHAKVTVTVRAGATAGVIGCTDPRLIEWAATDPELDHPPPPEAP
jgi:predicted DNA-binding antitoxin AbrB/MazE fold protein